MTDTVVTTALTFPHDEGLPNISDGSETWESAGFQMALAQTTESESYIRNDVDLAFTNHNGTDNTVELTPGLAYLNLGGETVNVQSTLGGDDPPAYDTTLPGDPGLMVVAPATIGPLSLTSATVNDVWLAYATDNSVTGISPGDIWVRHGSGLSAPTAHPHVKVGTVNPDGPSTDALLNRYPRPTFETTTIRDTETDPTSDGVFTQNNGDVKVGTGGGTKSLSDIGSSGDVDHDDWNMVNVVADGGADNTGTNDATTAINSVVATDTLVMFPPGEYLVDSGSINANGLSRIGFWAPAGGVSLKITSAKTGNVFDVGYATNACDHVRIEGFTFDYTALDTGTRAVSLGVTEYASVKNCTVVGEDDAGSNGPIRVDALEPDSLVHVEGWHTPDGGQHAVNTPGGTSPTGFFIGADNRGTVIVDGCTVANYPDNGIYTSLSAVEGAVIVRGGYYANNDIAQVRLATEGSQVLSATIAMTAEKADDAIQRGIWLRNNEALHVENCRVVMNTPKAGPGFQVESDCPSATIRGGRVQNDVNGVASILVKTLDVGVANQPVVIDGVTAIGSGTGDGSHQYAINLARPGCVLRDCYLQQNPAGVVPKYGVQCDDNTHIQGGFYNTDARSIYGNGDHVIVENVEARGGSNDLRPRGADWDFRSMHAADYDSVYWGDATRPRWDGVIGGGPIGGVDLSLAGNAGQHQGDTAISDGATPATAKGTLAYWEAGTTSWVTTANIIAAGTATLAGGTATVSTGVTTTGTHIDVSLDPSGGGVNTADVKAVARAYWDNTAGEYKVEILEDGTSVGNPDIGYVIVGA